MFVNGKENTIVERRRRRRSKDECVSVFGRVGFILILIE